MASSNQTPDVLFSPIAANADASDINTIPQTYDPANYGYAAQNVGFPTECRLPVLNPDGTLGQGRAPRMQDWNGIMKLVSSHNFFLQNGGSYTFNPTVSANLGGYPKNAVLWYFPENEDPCLVYSLINDNTNNFVDDPTLIDDEHWKKLSFGDRISSPFFFGWSQYFENAPYNASWLASNGQYNAASVYPDFWTQLTGVELNNSLNVGDTIEIGGKTYVKRGLPVVLSTGTYTDYDFIINTSDQTFRLPLLNGEEDLPGDTYENLTLQASGSTYTVPANGTVLFGRKANIPSGGFTAGLTENITSGMEGTHYTLNGTYGYGFSVLPVLKGDVFMLLYSATTGAEPDTLRFYYAKGNGTLYYYVGDTVQDASLINAGAVLGQLSNKADIDLSNLSSGLANTICTTPATTTSSASSAKPAVVVENYKNGTSWYRVWSDGWCEQGGTATVETSPSAVAGNTITLLKSYANTNYTVIIGGRVTRNTTSTEPGVIVVNTSSFAISTSDDARTFYWQASGYTR